MAAEVLVPSAVSSASARSDVSSVRKFTTVTRRDYRLRKTIVIRYASRVISTVTKRVEPNGPA